MIDVDIRDLVFLPDQRMSLLDVVRVINARWYMAQQDDGDYYLAASVREIGDLGTDYVSDYDLEIDDFIVVENPDKRFSEDTGFSVNGMGFLPGTIIE